MSWRGMHHHAWRLVDDYHVIVFKQNVQRHFLWLRISGHRRRNLNLYIVIIRHLHPCLLGHSAIDRHKAGLYEAFDARAREIGIARQQKFVKSLQFSHLRLALQTRACSRAASLSSLDPRRQEQALSRRRRQHSSRNRHRPQDGSPLDALRLEFG